jgi:hypothetical protein
MDKHSSLIGPFICFEKTSVENMTAGAFTTKLYGLVIFEKWTNFVVS